MENTAKCTKQHILRSFSQSSCLGTDVPESLSGFVIRPKRRTSSSILKEKKRVWALKNMQLTGKVGSSFKGFTKLLKLTAQWKTLPLIQ